jgi:valacyclovir hydrolase
MLHGFLGTAHRHFAHMIQEFRSEHRVIAPDLRGYGESRPPLRSFPGNFIERDADDVAHLLDALRCTGAVVLGFSDGGESALILAAKRPDLVRALVVWGAFGQITPSAMEWLESLLPVESWGPDLAPWRDSIIEHHGREQWPSLITAYVETARLAFADGWDVPLQHAKSIRCPVLQLHGETEQQANRRFVAQLAAALPDGRMETVAGAGHSLQLEKPNELIGLIRSFLRSVDE